MILTLERFKFTDKSTIGSLAIDGADFCWTLELPIGDGGPGSAIPAGTYKVVTYPSPKFERLMPLLMDVPGRSTIEMHWGNEPENTDGCILLGNSMPGEDFIGNSRQAFDDFWEKAQGPMEAGDCTIVVK
jgi:hypothetical protein